MWGANNEAKGSGREIGGGDKDMDSGGYSPLVVRHGVGEQKAIGDVLKLAESFIFLEVCTPHYYSSTLVGWFSDDVIAVSEISKC